MESFSNIIVYIREQLKTNYEVREATAIAREVAQHYFGISMVQAYAGTARTLDDKEKNLLKQILQRLRHNEPVQYVTGQAQFLGRSFQVAPGVLIPRPETEELVNLVIQNHASVPAPTIVDAGTGSGCIAISLQLAFPKASVWGIDISAEAIRQAQHNAAKFLAPVHWLKADILEPKTLPTFPIDILISNPPYVRESERQEMDAHVKDFEPEEALFVPDDDPLKFYRSLAFWAMRSLKDHGTIYAEINASLAHDTSNLFNKEGFHSVELLRDQFGKERMIICKK